MFSKEEYEIEESYRQTHTYRNGDAVYVYPYGPLLGIRGEVVDATYQENGMILVETEKGKRWYSRHSIAPLFY